MHLRRWGAVAGAVVAIGTLFFTGITTYYQAQVSEDQLKQSRQIADRDERDQASRVAIWAEADEYNGRVHILNRSFDPITVMDLTVQIKTSDPDDPSKFLIHLQVVLSPCTELVYNSTGLSLGGEKTNLTLLGDHDWRVLRLSFQERNGREWTRSERGLHEGVLRERDAEPGDTLRTPFIEQAQGCGVGQPAPVATG